MRIYLYKWSIVVQHTTALCPTISYTRQAAYRLWETIGGYDEQMFIDSVDFEFCYRLRANGYKVLQTSVLRLEHSLGDSKILRFLWIKFRNSEHNAFRTYFIAQNNIYYPKKHHLWLHLIRGNLRNIKQILIVLGYENFR